MPDGFCHFGVAQLRSRERVEFKQVEKSTLYAWTAYANAHCHPGDENRRQPTLNLQNSGKMLIMKRLIALFCCLFLATLSFAAPLASNAKTAIPADVQQIISVDYRALRNSDSGMALKAKILPDNLKQFENALKDMGIDPDTDVEGLSFVMFRAGKQLRSVGFATGDFQVKKFLAKQKAAKTKPEKYRTAFLYPASGMSMTFLDDTTMLFAILSRSTTPWTPATERLRA